MDRLSSVLPVDGKRRYPLPESVAEAELLAASIERAVRRETGGSVQKLCVEVHRNGILLSGRCNTYYTKQKAQHAAMTFCSSGRQLTNRIEVT